MDEVKKVLQEEQQVFFLREGITTVTVSESGKGIIIAEKMLQKIIDKKTVLYLSGGKTPKILYEHLAELEIHPGAVGMIDERYGKKWHSNSNELMIRETGLLRILELQGIPFHPILLSPPHANLLPSRERVEEREQTADEYDQKVRELLAQYSKSVGILGIGKDGHTAGLPAGISKLQISNSKKMETEFVVDYNDTVGIYGERVTMTFLGLSMLDILIILAFGPDKKQALKMMFMDGSEKEVPARFYTRSDIAKKTILITDQEIESM